MEAILVAEGVRVLTDAELREATGTPGLHRRVAFEGDGHWFGHVTTDPESFSGWHHHGDTLTIGYVVEGLVRFEFGPRGSHSVEIGEGGFFQVPPRLVHREGKPTTEPGQIVLVRVGEGPPVFPVDGPEPA